MLVVKKCGETCASKQSKKVESIDESWTSEREKFCYCVYEENVPILTIQVICINILLKKIAFFSKQNSVRRETNKMLTSLTTRQIFTLVVFSTMRWDAIAFVVGL